MGAKRSVQKPSDLYLTYEKVAARTGDQYYKIGVIEDGSVPKVYVDTQTLELKYDPIVYDGTWQSNQSVVMKLNNEGRGIDYNWDNVVIPNRNLTISAAIDQGEVDTRPLNFRVAFEATSQTTIRLITGKNRTHFAFSYTNSQSGLTFYLNPQLVNGVKTIVATNDTSPDARFHFTISPTSYSPPS